MTQNQLILSGPAVSLDFNLSSSILTWADVMDRGWAGGLSTAVGAWVGGWGGDCLD